MKKIAIFTLALLSFFMCNLSPKAEDVPEIVLYGFGDDYADDDYLTLYHNKTCYVSIKNIPVSEINNIHLIFSDETVAEVKDISYNTSANPVITAVIKAKKLGTTDIVASLSLDGTTYTSNEITTTVRETNYRIQIYREDNLIEEPINKGETLKLKAILVYGMAAHVGDISSNGVTWKSSNESVLKVDNSGLVTAVGVGTADIITEYTTEENVLISSSFTLEVKGNNDIPSSAKIKFYLDEPGPAMTLDYEDKFSVGLVDIPSTERENIKFRVENEDIAKIIKVDYEQEYADAVVTLKYLSAGKTKLVASLDYNGKTYTDEYNIDVKKGSAPENPKTGDSLPFLTLGMCAIVGVIVFIIINRNKKIYKI